MRKILILALISGFLMSCSSKILLPYHEDTLCHAGEQGGYCGSLYDVYKNQEDNQ